MESIMILGADLYNRDHLTTASFVCRQHESKENLLL